MRSLGYAIEIKFANVRHSLDDSLVNGIEKDICHLSALPDCVRRYLLLIDEAEAITPAEIRSILDNMKSKNITLVSNNQMLIKDV